MKIIIAILVTAVVSAGITFLAVPNNKGNGAAPEPSKLGAQNAELRKALQIAKREAKREKTKKKKKRKLEEEASDATTSKKKKKII